MTEDELRLAAAGDAEQLDRLSEALAARPRPGDKALKALDRLAPHETARLVLALRPKRARALLRRLDDAPQLALLGALDPAISELLLEPEEQERIARIVGRLDVQTAADLLARAPEELARAVVARAPQGAALAAALHHHAETAGAVMRRRLVAADEDWTVARTVEEIRARSDLIDKLHAVHVVDGTGRLTGYLKVRDLLLSPGDTRVGDIARPVPATVDAGIDREEVLRIARERNLKVLPVVDDGGCLIGMVTADELSAIARAEAEEDMKLMAGLDPQASAADGPLRILRRRLPWLAAGLVGSGVAAIVVGSYEDALTEAAILASLIPVVMSLAGNAGIQASTVTVQALTSGALWVGDLAGRTLREAGGAALTGGSVGLVVAAAILALSRFVDIERPAALALAATLTLVAVTVQASVIGALVPVLLARLRLDPAVATGVFITTSNDVVGVLVFFAIATAIYI